MELVVLVLILLIVGGTVAVGKYIVKSVLDSESEDAKDGQP